MPDRWTVEYAGRGMRLRMRLALTSFKHVGIFPEQAANWDFIYDRCRELAGGGASAGERRADGRRAEGAEPVRLYGRRDARSPGGRGPR